MSRDATPADLPPADGRSLRRLLLGVFLLGAVAVLIVSNALLTHRFAEALRSRAELRLALYSGAILGELQRNSVVPLMLSRDPTLISALVSADFVATSRRLIAFQEEIGAASILLLDTGGRAVAATDRTWIGTQHANAAHFVQARRTNDTVFTTVEQETGRASFAYSRRILSGREEAGVIVVGVDLAKLEGRWAGIAEAVAVTDSQDRVVLSTQPGWHGHELSAAVTAGAPGRTLAGTADALAKALGAATADAWVNGTAAMRVDGKIPFQGWRIASFPEFRSVRERVNAVLALEVTGFTMLLALGFYRLSWRARRQSARLQRESAALRRLNLRLQREIAEREKAQANLRVAEQTLAQSSKLAVLGEMSASVSHELNQPLAAMKTYLAGARLLLQRRRPEEALASFQRIDHLIDRMSAIARQLKGYVRKGTDAFQPLDMRDSIEAALAIMEPQLNAGHIRVAISLPMEPVMVRADPVRLEQIVVNLVRNAMDALRGQADAEIDLLLAAGDTVTLTVRDNGPGIADLDSLFEPFYTTKPPGEGVGLGLAISTGIARDFGGRLTARNGADRGAVFELSLPGDGGQDLRAAE
jgi:two-component system, NtrC family, C4-dicarboxylate transport sensor histidine kinase DctB